VIYLNLEDLFGKERNNIQNSYIQVMGLNLEDNFRIGKSNITPMEMEYKRNEWIPFFKYLQWRKIEKEIEKNKKEDLSERRREKNENEK
jgi:hypothetical protein